jgi:hypothetical protein
MKQNQKIQSESEIETLIKFHLIFHLFYLKRYIWIRIIFFIIFIFIIFTIPYDSYRYAYCIALINFLLSSQLDLGKIRLELEHTIFAIFKCTRNTASSRVECARHNLQRRMYTWWLLLRGTRSTLGIATRCSAGSYDLRKLRLRDIWRRRF